MPEPEPKNEKIPPGPKMRFWAETFVVAVKSNNATEKNGLNCIILLVDMFFDAGVLERLFLFVRTLVQTESYW